MGKTGNSIGEKPMNNKEQILAERERKPAKRVDVVSVKLVKEKSFLYKQRTVSSPQSAYELVKEILENEDREKLVACFLNVKNQPVALHVVSIGTINSSFVHPREIFKVAVLSNAASIILFHNHPSGDPTPSQEDFNATERIRDCGKLMGIELLDHVIVGDGKYYSTKENGRI